MATNYPNGSDTFIEPESPETTPLSQAGSGNFNHVQSHTNMGDAIEALQEHAALKIHDHSGAIGEDVERAKGYKLRQANTHEDSDLDSASTALHHTLGAGAFQAAPGNHNHEYASLLNTPFRICTSTTRPTGVSAGTMIYETDTNRMRVWAQFGKANTAVSGVDSTDSFDRTSSLNMGTALWLQTYMPGSQGVMATPDGNHLSWIESGNDMARCVARRINPPDAHTDTTNQIIIWKVGGTGIEYYLPFIGATTASNDMYFRMSDDSLEYLRVCFTYNQWGKGFITLYGTRNGPGGEQAIGQLSAKTEKTNVYWIAEMIGNTLTVWLADNLQGSSVLIGKIADHNNIASNDSVRNLGWGVGMVAGNRQGLDAVIAGQVHPAEISLVTIKDAVYYVGRPVWQLLPVASIPIVRLRQLSSQQIGENGTYIGWDQEIEDNFGFFNPASPTIVTASEAGLYHIDAALQWNDNVVPENGTVVITINGAETNLSNTRYQKTGALNSPAGFTQTLSVSGKVRLAAGDQVQMKCKHTAVPQNLINQILSYFDGPSKVSSRFDMIYSSP